MFFEVIVPLIGMRDARLFMITTPVDQYNFFSKLVRRLDPVSRLPMFDFIHVQLACKRCIAANRTKLCKHRLKYLPPWKSEDAMSLIREIMKDHEALFNRENLGMIAEAGGALIPFAIVEKWMAMERFDPGPRKLTAPMFITVMDPNGGASENASEMAIVSIAFLFGQLVAAGYDEEINLVRDHIAKLFESDFLHHAVCFYIPENSMGHSIGHVYDALITRWGERKIQSYFALKTADNMPYGDPGIVTSHKRKLDYASSLRSAMARGSLAIWKDFVVANRYIENVSDRHAIMWRKTEEQLSRYRVVTIESDRPNSTTKVVVSGVVDKTGKKNASENDDAAFSLSFALGMSDAIIDQQLEGFNYQYVP